MRIVIDMQGAQTSSRFRGIGRYTLSFAKAVIRNRGEHEIILALSGMLPNTIESIRNTFDGILKQENIRVWHAIGPVKEESSGNESRRCIAELMREAFLASLQPDVVHIASLFEGFVDDAVTSTGCFGDDIPVTTMLYDLIPLLNPEQYLKPNPNYADFYQRKLKMLGNAKSLFAISEFSRQEALSNLSMNPDKVVNVSTAVEDSFSPIAFEETRKKSMRLAFSLQRPFVLYTGGIDERKNLPRLIQAYAKLPFNLRMNQQLVFGGNIGENDVAYFKQIARNEGMEEDEFTFTGYVTDEQLTQLYNTCLLYVFPSWHEGFGLPALEAMACGAVVIGANTSSLPEVIGMQDALFDPFDVNAISAKMQLALTDEVFRDLLRNHGLLQAKKFSWDETAKKSLEEWKKLSSAKNNIRSNTILREGKLIKAIAPFLTSADEASIISTSQFLAQNASAGIVRQLFVDVSELCQRDAATGVQRVVRSYLLQLLNDPPCGFSVQPVYATQTEGYRYAKAFTKKIMDQDSSIESDQFIRWMRGDIFFALDMQHHVQLAHANDYVLMRKDGVVVKFLVYDLLPIQLSDYFKESSSKQLHEQWLEMIASQDEAICISKATKDAYEEWLITKKISRNNGFTTNWVHIGADIESSKPSFGMPENAEELLSIIRSKTTFLAVSTLEPRKAQTQILDAVEQLWLKGVDVNLVFVGQQGWKIDDFVERISSHVEKNNRLFWLKGISDEYLDQVYTASSCLVAASINEGFGLPLIEAARHGIPIVARDIPIFREVASNHAYYFSGYESEDLAKALDEWLLLNRVRSAPESKEISWSTWSQSTESLKKILINQNYKRRQLFIDISTLVLHDARTGIQRVVRSVLNELLLNPPEGYRVEPIYATVNQGYRYARQIREKFLDEARSLCSDDLIDFSPGDIFLGLDLDHHAPRVHSSFLKYIKDQGVGVYFMVYDLLPIQFPNFWEPQHQVDRVVSEWLSVITNLSGAICISESVSKELQEWIDQNKPSLKNKFSINWFHLGADVENSVPTLGLPSDADYVLSQLKIRPSFLMVGTIEPRKGHLQVLDAFDDLWKSGADVNLVIVGKQGWMVDILVSRLRLHSELYKRLFWLEGISDEFLETLYANSTCLIAASFGEGFGLPLIEAAQHNLPIIARDINVFREVADKNAYYFKTDQSTELSHNVKEWLMLYKSNQHPKSENMNWFSWKESTKKLVEILHDNQ
jgi:glycosyltransferase involved in cell wall biosynthesis